MKGPLPRPQISRHRESRPRKHRKKHSLDDLPAEIVLQIMSHLSTPTLISLRFASFRYYALSSQIPLITQLWFSPYLEDRKTFMGVCDHPFLGEHVTALTYDITRFEDFSLEELRKLWPRPWKYTAEIRPLYLRGKDWLENHPGLWQYQKVVKEAKHSAIYEGRMLTEGLRKLHSVKTFSDEAEAVQPVYQPLPTCT